MDHPYLIKREAGVVKQGESVGMTFMSRVLEQTVRLGIAHRSVLNSRGMIRRIDDPENEVKDLGRGVESRLLTQPGLSFSALHYTFTPTEGTLPASFVDVHNHRKAIEVHVYRDAAAVYLHGSIIDVPKDTIIAIAPETAHATAAIQGRIEGRSLERPVLYFPPLPEGDTHKAGHATQSEWTARLKVLAERVTGKPSVNAPVQKGINIPRPRTRYGIDV